MLHRNVFFKGLEFAQNITESALLSAFKKRPLSTQTSIDKDDLVA